MSRNGIGFVIQANAPIDARIERLIQATNSPNTSHTVLNNPDYAAHLKSNVAPSSHFYCRNYDADGDENDWSQYQPVDYFNKYQWQVAGKGLGLQIGNEPGFGKPITQALTRFMIEAEKRGIPVSVGGFSVGTTPDSPGAWAEHDEFVQTLCRRPDLFTLDSHEYALGVPTSGMVTKDTKPGEVLYFTQHLLRKDQWPKSVNELSNMYHIGRIGHLFAYCRSKGYNKPTVDIGECAIDFVSDVAEVSAWGKSLPHTNPNPVVQHIRGYKSMGRFWPEQVVSGQNVQKTHMDILEWVRGVVYDALGVRSMRVFTVGNSGSGAVAHNWVDFDWNDDIAMQDAFYQWAFSSAPPVIPPLPTLPPLPELPPLPLDPLPKPIVAIREVRKALERVTLMESILADQRNTIDLMEAMIADQREQLLLALKDMQ